MSKETCNMQTLMKLLGKRWTYPILIALKSKKAATFNSLERHMKNRISPRALSMILKLLMEFHLITKAENYYSITPHGESFIDLRKALKAWCHANEKELPDGCDLNCIDCKYY